MGEPFEIDNEGVGDLGMDEILIVHVVNLLGLDDLALLEKFEGHELAILLVLGYLDFAEPTYVYMHQYLCPECARSRNPPA